jgi:D-alanyl-D-alanine carboxypeptidase
MRSRGYRTAALLILGVLVAGPAAAADRRPLAVNPAALDSALRSARSRTGAPAAQAAIVACGQVMWAGASGVTDLRSKRPVSNATPFVIASTTKTVTATMIMQEVQAGRLSLTTRLSRFYPQLPNANRITLRMLLGNRSGLPEYDVTKGSRHRWTRNDILSTIRTAEFPPNTPEYRNTNWIILGGILEKVSGMPVEAYFRDHVAKRAEMTSTSTFDRSQKILDEMARPYERELDGSLTSSWVKGFGLPTNYWGPVFTDGGLVSTATDLARFGNALMRGQLVDKKTLAQMTRIAQDDNYGLGISSENFDGHYWLGHDGSYGGYESENWTDPKREVTITVTTNLGLVSDKHAGVARRIWDAVVRAYENRASRSRPTRCKSRM